MARDLPQAFQIFLRARNKAKSVAALTARGASFFSRSMFRELNVLREGLLDRWEDFVRL